MDEENMMNSDQRIEDDAMMDMDPKELWKMLQEAKRREEEAERKARELSQQLLETQADNENKTQKLNRLSSKSLDKSQLPIWDGFMPSLGLTHNT